MVSRRAPVRSLADDLRTRPDDALARLVVGRPDLANPVPSGTSALAARASTRVSVHRAMASLDTPALQVLQAVAALGSPTTVTAVAAACGASATVVGPLVDRLLTAALAWGSRRELHLVRAAADLVGPYPAGLGPRLADLGLVRSPSRLAGLVVDAGLEPTGDPAADLDLLAARWSDPGVLTATLAPAPDGARSLVERLDAGHPVGAVPQADRTVRAQDAKGPVEWLLARGLIVAVDPEHVVLPREVGLGLRGGRVHPGLHGEPDLPRRERGTARVDGVAAGAAAEVVRLVELLGAAWGATPSPVLRSGGVGVRELRRTAADLEVTTSETALVIEIAYAAGLVADDGEADPRWAPTPAYDEWRRLDVASRWVTLARTWLRMPRAPGLVGTRDERDSARAALSDTLVRASAPTLRDAVLSVLLDAGPGQEVTAADVDARLAWLRPRGGASSGYTGAAEVLVEAGWVGLVGLGAAATAARELVAGDPDRAAAAVARALPPEVDHVLLQADLTAVAPGPLRPDVAAEIALLADVDSRGGATVYRFGPGTVRRALDAGRSADDVLTFLAAHSATPVPQPLEYLVTDTARRHGQLRVGAAGAYLRSDDEATLSELLADRKASGLRLRRLAPTVLVSAADPATVLGVLRDLGLVPAAEAEDGSLLVRRPTSHRTPPRNPPTAAGRRPPVLDEASALEVVTLLRERDAAADAEPSRSATAGAPAVPVLDPAVSLDVLRRAGADRRTVWVAVVDASGRVARQLVEPLSVDGGRVTVLDHALGTQRTLTVARITGVVDATGVVGAP